MPDNYLDATMKQGEQSLARRSESIAKFNAEHPPQAERTIKPYGEQVTVGVWEQVASDGGSSYGYAVKRSNGYNPQEIHWLSSEILGMIEAARFERLTDEQRAEIFSELQHLYCLSCGTKQNQFQRCQCANDE